jgi:arabinose-5-phosphate isomerase
MYNGAVMAMEFAREVLRAEAQAVSSLQVGPSFEEAVRAILVCKGQVVATGMGKAGIIAQKVSATLASTGTRSIFLHPAEAAHGDLGRIGPEDLVLAFSNSGETDELVELLPPIRKIGAKVVSITSSRTSAVGQGSDLVLEIGRIEEPCPLKLAPSASTTAMLALGDALALCVLKERGWDESRYAMLHPAGELGRRLKRVEEIMRTGERQAVVEERAKVRDAVVEITRCRAGAVSVVDGSGRLAGIFTDGDLRRWISKDPGVLEREIGAVMTRDPKRARPGDLAIEAAARMIEKKIDELPVVDESGRPVGMLDVQDLLELGLL